MAATLLAMTVASLLSGLNADQRQAAEAVNGPLCIIAGAGTGKTRTITHRIAHQVLSGVASADQILAVTFTDKAATELRERLRGLGLPAPVRAATFHAAAWAQLRFFWSRTSDEPLPEVLASKLRLLVPLARRTSSQAADLAAEIEWAKARRLEPGDYPTAAANRRGPLEPERMAAVYDEYERTKSRANLIDYEDMLLRTTAAIEQLPEVSSEVRRRYRFFTVDEFQDVNPAQFALLRAWLGSSRELCVVGDDDQSIYGFTGATPGYLTDFPRHFPEARTVILTRNYRSTPQILALANGVLAGKGGSAKRLEPFRDDGPKPVLRGFDDGDAEVSGVVASVARLLTDEPGTSIAVCYRVNSQSEPYEAALRSARIDYTVRGAGGFYQRAEIRQALTVLRAAAQRPPPAPPAGLEDTVAARPATADTLLRRALREQMGHDPRREPGGATARERWQNLNQLTDVSAAVVAGAPSTSLAELVEELTLRSRDGERHGTGAVTLLTLHKAKGLEFDAVFLVAVEEGLLPISYARTDSEIDEERRLAYVGVTRARRHLHVSWALRRTGGSGRATPRRPSRFLDPLLPAGESAKRPGASPRMSGRSGAGTGAGRCGCGTRLEAAADRRRGSCWACFSGGADPAVAERLRRWRAQRATTDEVPAFVVFNDRTLAELARTQPTTPRALLRVNGLGPAKVERYGADLLGLLAETAS